MRPAVQNSVSNKARTFATMPSSFLDLASEHRICKVRVPFWSSVEMLMNSAE